MFSPPAYAELLFKQLTESQSLELSCSPQQEHSTLIYLHLYHRSAQSQTTLLSMAEGGGLRVNTDHRGRLQLRGGLDSLQVNVTVTLLQRSDTGLYVWELNYRVDNSSDQISLSAPKVFLLVEGTGMWFRHLTIHSAAVKKPSTSVQTEMCLGVCVCGAGRSCQCSPSYPPLLLTIFTIAGLLLLTLSWLVIEKCVSVHTFN